MNLLERDESLATLQGMQRSAAAGRGALVFIEGEAGIGKTALMRAFAKRADVLTRWGACEALQTPRPLGPLYDIATQAAGELRTLLEHGTDRLRIFGAFLELLAAQPCIVLLEDLHWADDATLDLLRYLGRRIERTRCLAVASYRNDEVGAAHPLRLVLGDLATSGVHRLVPQPLSLNAVRELAADRGVDVAELHRRTGGNPFFVTEVLAAGSLEVPGSVRDAVLTRVARLHPAARAILDAAAVAGPRVEPWLLQYLVAAESSAVEECLASGVLRVSEGVFEFRHELAREAVLQEITPTRLLSLHRLTLRSLQVPGAPSVDLARLAHHAEAAELEEEVLRFAPAAAQGAAAKGAHRQAAQQFARALRYVRSRPLRRAALLDEYASELQFGGQLDGAIDARQAAVRLWRAAGDAQREAISLSRVAHALVIAGRNAPGEAAMRAARSLVERHADTVADVTTRRWAAYLRMLDRDVEDAIKEGLLALSVAERLGDWESTVHCLNTIGSSMIVSGQIEEGRRYLEKSWTLAERMSSDFWISNALGNLGTACGEAYRFDLAEDYLRQGIGFCAERDIDYARLYQLSWLALVHLYRAQWTEAAAAAHTVLADQRSPGIARITALIALGRVRARRGDPGVWEVLDEGRRLAGDTGTLQRIAPMLAARAEAAWLEGRGADAATEATAGVDLAIRKRHAWFTSELSFWCQRGGAATPGFIPEFCAHLPFALEAVGRWSEAADAWRLLACPFETARALSHGDAAAQREALATFESLGARPMIERVRRQLRAAGVRGLPRGPRASTKEHPCGLTSREVAVLVLLVRGLRTKEIGQRLHRSARTVDHHLAAIFTKLDVATRSEAVSAAYRLRLVQPEGG